MKQPWERPLSEIYPINKYGVKRRYYDPRPGGQQPYVSKVEATEQERQESTERLAAEFNARRTRRARGKMKRDPLCAYCCYPVPDESQYRKYCTARCYNRHNRKGKSHGKKPVA